MPLSSLEHLVLQLVCSENKKYRGGVATNTIAALAKPYSISATVGTLHVLKSEGLLSVTGSADHSRGWTPTTRGEAVLRRAGGVKGLPAAKEQEVKAFQAEEGKRQAEELTLFLSGRDRISTELLDRCAAMNAALLAQAEKAHAAGDADAWRDLAWLIETGKQLVAVGGEA
ncbi:hypothetical protein [Vreelandella nanhaiensis]|uniref:Uncharacterized protein n=1 Tax=Vreelandella nanhaiensis TaxID=1258546 RepID=A0A3S0YN51_9GAMM|nr:hypothetical protein [Halomonas nanhaiensis]RUR34495.1 hypothetical protein ELY38_02580 [Halomonas nanhaiensis]